MTGPAQSLLRYSSSWRWLSGWALDTSWRRATAPSAAHAMRPSGGRPHRPDVAPIAGSVRGPSGRSVFTSRPCRESGHTHDVFERFNDRGRRLVVIAQEQARLLNHHYIGTEHLLLAIAADSEGPAGSILRDAGLLYDSLRAEVLEMIGPAAGQEPTGHIPFTPRAKKVLELSLREAVTLGHRYIGTEHILLGLIREGEGVAVQAMVRLGANLDDVADRARSIAGELAPEQGWVSGGAQPPRCARCGSSLASNAGYSVVEAAADTDDGEPVRVVIVYCRACGAAIGGAS